MKCSSNRRYPAKSYCFRRNKRASDGLAVMPSGVLEKGKQIRHAKQVSNLFAGVGHLQVAAARSRRNVQPDNAAEPGTVHQRDLFHVENDPFVNTNLVAHGIFQRGGIFECQFPMALGDQRFVQFIAFHAKTSRAAQACIGHKALLSSVWGSPASLYPNGTRIARDPLRGCWNRVKLVECSARSSG